MGTTNEQPPKTLYYYCSLNTFFSIIKNKSIRLTEIAKSNDALEQRFLAMEIVNHLETFVNIVGDKNITKADIKELKTIYRDKVDLLQPIPVWAICFSEEGDDLSQWRGYGDDGEGICIGFNFKYLNVINCLNNSYNFDFMRFRKIEYGQEAINKYFKYLKENSKPRNLNWYEIKDYLDKIIYGLISVPYYKSGAFKAESEWRIVYSYDSLIEDYIYNFDELNKIKPFSNNFKIINKEYQVYNGYLKSYLEIQIKKILKCIDVIYIGPKSKVSKEDMKRFLYETIGFENNFKIEYSRADSYR